MDALGTERLDLETEALLRLLVEGLDTVRRELGPLEMLREDGDGEGGLTMRFVLVEGEGDGLGLTTRVVRDDALDDERGVGVTTVRVDRLGLVTVAYDFSGARVTRGEAETEVRGRVVTTRDEDVEGRGAGAGVTTR